MDAQFARFNFDSNDNALDLAPSLSASLSMIVADNALTGARRATCEDIASIMSFLADFPVQSESI